MNRDLLFALSKLAFQRKLAAGLPGAALAGAGKRVAGAGMNPHAVQEFLGELAGSGTRSTVGKPSTWSPGGTPGVTRNLAEARSTSRAAAAAPRPTPAAAASDAWTAGAGPALGAQGPGGGGPPKGPPPPPTAGAPAGAPGGGGPPGGFDPWMLGAAGLAALAGGMGAKPAPQQWYHNPMAVGAAGLGGGMLLSHLMRDDRDR